MVANPMEDGASDDELIAEYIVVDHERGGIEDARLARFGVPVWAVVGALPAGQSEQGDRDNVARAYRLPIAAVHAAYAFYERHRPLIDARIAANAFPDA